MAVRAGLLFFGEIVMALAKNTSSFGRPDRRGLP
jgi:hypothetical protein